ncbi:ribosome biogenesis GTPase YqeH [Corticicoccus populi]|uniref:Ribosome biogenesis GTPase YqeH n=1 Tax=Corticicoccus populi TaxID=1812821 RepID=A0ABW5WRW3_9STAP
MGELKCIGCGAALQSNDQNQPGYIPESGLMKEDAICKRCYRLKHYNEVMDVDVASGDFLTMLNSLYETTGVIVKVIDVFDFNGSLVPSFNRIVGDKKVIAVINKLDLLPKSTNRKRLIHRAKHMLKEAGITAVETVAVSALKNDGVDELVEVISKYSSNQDVYVVGTTNVGKSTLINQLIKRSTGDDNVITTSRFPGTTLDLIDIPLDESHFIYDTPGIVVPSQMAHYVKPKDLKYITPAKEIKPKTFQLNPEQTLFIGNLARVDFTGGRRTSFSIYGCQHLTIHRTKLERADEFYEKHYNTLLGPPELDESLLLKNGKDITFQMNEDSDILISGLAFVAVQSGAEVTVKVPDGVEVSVRPTIFKGGV